MLHEVLHKARITVFCFGLHSTAEHLRENLRLSRLAKAAAMSHPEAACRCGLLGRAETALLGIRIHSFVQDPG